MRNCIGNTKEPFYGKHTSKESEGSFEIGRKAAIAAPPSLKIVKYRFLSVFTIGCSAPICQIVFIQNHQGLFENS